MSTVFASCCWLLVRSPCFMFSHAVKYWNPYTGLLIVRCTTDTHRQASSNTIIAWHPLQLQSASRRRQGACHSKSSAACDSGCARCGVVAAASTVSTTASQPSGFWSLPVSFIHHDDDSSSMHRTGTIRISQVLLQLFARTNRSMVRVLRVF